MRKTPHFDKTKNEYVSKLEKLYLVNPAIFYAFINYLIKCEYLVGYMDFSTKTECLKLPERDKIYPATIYHSYYEIFILSTQKDLMNQKTLRKHFDYITSENHFPQIIIIAKDEKNRQRIQSLLEPVLPKKTDDLDYNLALVTSAEFNKAFEDLKDIAIKDTISKMDALLQ